MASRAVEELSLLGLFNRIDEIEQLKEWKKVGEEDAAIIASEGATKKAIATELAETSAGLAKAEKTKAKAFLQAQLKAVDSSDKHASARRDKLSELLDAVEKAPPAEEPAHVRRGRDALKRVQREFKEIHEIYEKWEKGKMMFKTNDELKAMQQQHEDLQKCKEATQRYVDEMLSLRSSDARPPSLPGGPSAAARPKAKSAVRAADPAVHSAGFGSGSGYPTAKATARSSAVPVARAAIRKAELVAEVRADASMAWNFAEEAPRAAKPPRAKPAAEEPETVVLSYSCTCRAVADILGITLEQARDLSESASEFRRQLTNGQWEQVKERSLAIEKEQKEREKEKEQKKKDKALARVLDKQGPPALAGTTAPLPSANRGAAPVAKAAVKAKAAPKSKSASQPKKNVATLATANRFAGMSDDDDDDGGWKTVQK